MLSSLSSSSHRASVVVFIVVQYVRTFIVYPPYRLSEIMCGVFVCSVR